MMRLLRLTHTPILQQLQIEEALMRATDDAWCLVNIGSPPAIVMGISGKPEQLLEEPLYRQHSLPLIRRFSGGGCVVVDEDTLFISLMGPKTLLPCSPFPCSIMNWTADAFYRPLMGNLGFALKGNDYALGNRKFGGNAQYLQKERWLHHSTLLWDYHPERMACLSMPPVVPAYRANRAHQEFLCKLKDRFPSKEEFVALFLENLDRHFRLAPTTLKEVEPLLEQPHRRATEVVRW